MVDRPTIQERENDSPLIIDIELTRHPRHDKLVIRRSDMGPKPPRRFNWPDKGMDQYIDGPRLDGIGIAVGIHEWCTGTVWLKKIGPYRSVLACDGGCNLGVTVLGWPATYKDLAEKIHFPKDSYVPASGSPPDGDG